MNKFLFAVASASLLAASAADAGSPAIPRLSSAPRLAPIAAAVPSAKAALPGLQADLPDWLEYDTQVYPREVQYWSAGNAFAAASLGIGLATDANDPCGNATCNPAQNPSTFVAAEVGVAQSAPGRAQTVVRGLRAPPLPALP